VLLRRQRGLEPCERSIVHSLRRLGDDRALGYEPGAVNGVKIIPVNRARAGDTELAGSPLRADDARPRAL
jgi:hypothetical protein